MTERDCFANDWIGCFATGRSATPNQDVLLIWADWEEDNGDERLSHFLRYLFDNQKWPRWAGGWTFTLVDPTNHAWEHYYLPITILNWEFYPTFVNSGRFLSASDIVSHLSKFYVRA